MTQQIGEMVTVRRHAGAPVAADRHPVEAERPDEIPIPNPEEAPPPGDPTPPRPSPPQPEVPPVEKPRREPPQPPEVIPPEGGDGRG